MPPPVWNHMDCGSGGTLVQFVIEERAFDLRRILRMSEHRQRVRKIERLQTEVWTTSQSTTVYRSGHLHGQEWTAT